MNNSKSTEQSKKYIYHHGQWEFFQFNFFAENLSRKERRFLNMIAFIAVVLGLFAVRTSELPRQSQSGESSSPAQMQENNAVVSQKRIAEQYGKLPLSFERNIGQTDNEVKFLSRGGGYTLFLTSTEAVLSIRKGKETAQPSNDGENSVDSKSVLKSSTAIEQAVVRMALENANPRPDVAGEAEMEGKSNYITLDDSREPVTNVSHYARVRYKEVYPGVDLIYYGNQRQLEYDFVVSPGIDPKAIKIRFEGSEKLETDKAGNLLLETAAGKIVQKAPIVYQEKDGARETVSAKYVIGDNHRVGFEIGNYDASRELVIDPILIYSTFLGGSNDDVGNDIAVNAVGEAFITGMTASTDFPTIAGLQMSDLDGTGKDAFVTKLNAAGTERVYSTYLGGMTDQEGNSIAIDSAGNAYITGVTGQNILQYKDAFLIKLNAAGTALAYPVVLFGGGTPDVGYNRADDIPYSVALDSANNAYITGETTATDFTAGQSISVIQPDNGALSDAFAVKVNAAGSIVYRTYLGKEGYQSGRGIAVDSAGNTFIVGSSTHSDYDGDGFILKLNSTGTALVYNTLPIGGPLGEDGASDVVIDGQGNAYVTGFTDSYYFPDTMGVVQTNYAGERDAFAVKVNASGNGFIWATYLGTARRQEGKGIARDSAGNIYIIGVDHFYDYDSSDFRFERTGDAFVLKLNSTASVHYYTQRYGEPGKKDVASAIVADANGNGYLTGSTFSYNFPTTPGAFDRTHNGNPNDAFVMKIGSGSSARNNLSVNEPPISKETSEAIAHDGNAISNDDVSLATVSSDLPTVSINNAFVFEGDSAGGITNVTFTVSLSAPSSRQVKVFYATKDGTANSEDYGEVADIVPIPAGALSRTIEVPVYGDTLREFKETFYVNLLEVSNATIGDGQGEGVILNDDVNNSHFVSQSVPERMIPGRNYEVSVTVHNTGNTTWSTNNQYRLASQTPMDNLTWGLNRVELPVSVLPGEKVTFTFDVRAPEIPGTYSFHWRMVQDGVEHFGDFSECLFIDVNPRRADLSYFEGDGKSDVSVFQPENGKWFLLPFLTGLSHVNFASVSEKITLADNHGVN